MNIANFEQNINQIIVVRGLEYFREERIEDIEDAGDHLYIATVSLVGQLLQQYPRKPAFRQELQSVKLTGEEKKCKTRF